MTVKTFDHLDFPAIISTPSNGVTTAGRVLRLKRKDGAGAYSREGSFAQSAATFPNFSATAIRSLTNFAAATLEEDSNGVALGTFGFQLSNDGGTTYYFWSGSDWVVAGAGDWSPEADVDENISTFPLPRPRQVQVRVRITPASSDCTPLLAQLALGFDTEGDVLEDLLLSLQNYLESNLTIRFYQDVVLDFASSTVVVDVFQNFSGIVGDPQVFNLTDDPTELVDLFSSASANRDDQTSTITLTGEQAADDFLRVRYEMKPFVFTAADDHIASSDQDAVDHRVGFPVARLPAVVLMLTRIQPDDPIEQFIDGDRIISTKRSSPEARTWPSRRLFRASFAVKFLSTLKTHNWSGSSAAKRIAELGRFFPSLGYGWHYEFLGFNVIDRSLVAQHLFGHDQTLEIRGYDADETGTSVPLLQEMNFQLGTFTEEIDDPVQVT